MVGDAGAPAPCRKLGSAADSDGALHSENVRDISCLPHVLLRDASQQMFVDVCYEVCSRVARPSTEPVMPPASTPTVRRSAAAHTELAAGCVQLPHMHSLRLILAAAAGCVMIYLLNLTDPGCCIVTWAMHD